MICCTEPGLTEALYNTHIYVHTDLLLLTVTLANDRPVLSSERALHINKPVTVGQ
jgi:hypothetical protein